MRAPFTVLGMQRVPPRPDGTERRNSFVFDVDVRGVVHQVRMRRSSHAVKLPPELVGDPLGPEIEVAVEAFMVAEARAVMRARQVV
jgi:hypothetical protein